MPEAARGTRTTWFVPGASRGPGRELTRQIRTGFHDAATRVPAGEPYRDGPADREPVPLHRMPDQAKVVAAMIDAVLSADSPRRLLLGSDAYARVRAALADRLAAADAQRDLGASTDVDGRASAEGSPHRG